MTRFEGGGVAENCLYMLGNVRNKGMKMCCHDLSGNGIDLIKELVRYEMSCDIER